uniref:Uncharacterized protein n=1 Tax=Romanomermis culicivorax TaxID=13658 RepID=A0A915J9L4_ROMCU
MDEENCKMQKLFKLSEDSREKLLDDKSDYLDLIAYNCEVGTDES